MSPSLSRTRTVHLMLPALLLIKIAAAAAASAAGESAVEIGVEGDIISAGYPNADAPCLDDHLSCPEWAEKGECGANPNYMLMHCERSCQVCSELDMGTEQEVTENEHTGKMRELIRRAEHYMRSEVLVKPGYESVRLTCRNQNKLCAFWAAIGECEANPNYMKLQCAPMCGTCERVDFNVRCPLDPDELDVWGPGDLDAMFLRITDESDPEFAKYKPTILSRPSHPEGADPDSATYKIGPWVVEFDEFTTEEESERLIHLGDVEGYERSTDVGRRKFDGTYDKHESSGRTSSNAWCQHECYEDPIAKKVVERIENLTGVPEKNSEYLQLLKYGEGQRYISHHDFIEHHVDRPLGPRILTLFLYLNDVEAGGGTNFPLLDLTVMPKRGKALLWPSVLDEDPNRKDERTAHQALPVERGMKYGANAWIHLRDFKTQNEKGCS